MITKRLFRKDVIDEYICNQCNGINGGMWQHLYTGKWAEGSLLSDINDMAHLVATKNKYKISDEL